MTQDRNDRRRRPQGGFSRKPGNPSDPRGRGGSPNDRPGGSGRHEGPRRGFAPDSGYRPAGGSPPNERPGDRRWQRGEGAGRPGQGSGGSGPPRHQGGGRPGAGRGESRRQPGPGPRDSYGPRGPGAPGGGSREHEGGQPASGGRSREHPGGQPASGGRSREYPGGRPRGEYRDRRPGQGQRPGGDWRSNQPPRDDTKAPGVAPEPSRRSGQLDPFGLFCAYHLGITADKKFRPANLNEVARRFGVGPGELKQALQDFGMDAAVVMEKEFDMAMAQLDIELAPEGIDKVELARQIYADFIEAPRRKIDWKKIIEEDIRENARIFGRKD